jgi:hypothetical protein
MDYKKLTVDEWKSLQTSRNSSGGYKGIWLSKNDGENSSLHIFKDELGRYHFIIEDGIVQHSDIEDPNINGLSIYINEYYIHQRERKRVIDIQCNLSHYIEEFNEIIKEIAKAIIDNGEIPYQAINRVIRNWKAFWSNQQRQLLTDEQIIGLVCELLIIKRLCYINPSNTLNSWTGPSKQRHDFIFSDWSFEIKGTRTQGHTHTINGIDQLKSYNDKSLAFISFIVSITDGDRSENLQSIVESIINESLVARPDLVVKFNELLSLYGYSPLYAEEYRRCKIDILEATLFIVNNSFPRLTSDNLHAPLDTRVTSVRYNISLDGLTGTDLNDVQWSNFFF